MALVLQRECLGCSAPIRIEKLETPIGRKKWERFNLDGSPHSCFNKSNNQIEEERAREEQAQTEPQQQQKHTTNNNFDSTDMRVILELLQLVNRKLDALLANHGVKQPL